MKRALALLALLAAGTAYYTFVHAEDYSVAGEAMGQRAHLALPTLAWSGYDPCHARLRHRVHRHVAHANGWSRHPCPRRRHRLARSDDKPRH